MDEVIFHAASPVGAVSDSEAAPISYCITCLQTTKTNQARSSGFVQRPCGIHMVVFVSESELMHVLHYVRDAG